jgi:hypothetical protein
MTRRLQARLQALEGASDDREPRIAHPSGADRTGLPARAAWPCATDQPVQDVQCSWLADQRAWQRGSRLGATRTRPGHCSEPDRPRTDPAGGRHDRRVYGSESQQFVPRRHSAGEAEALYGPRNPGVTYWSARPPGLERPTAAVAAGSLRWRGGVRGLAVPTWSVVASRRRPTGWRQGADPGNHRGDDGGRVATLSPSPRRIAPGAEVGGRGHRCAAGQPARSGGVDPRSPDLPERGRRPHDPFSW